jgi:hypothetical protein
MDLVSGLCVLKAESTGLVPASLLSGRHAGENGHSVVRIQPRTTDDRKRLDYLHQSATEPLPGPDHEAYGDFRYQAGSPIYHLTSPPLSGDPGWEPDPWQESNQLFGLVIYESNGSGKHIVYPISRIQSLARSIISSRQSLRYAWFGATGADIKIVPSSPVFREFDRRASV